MVSFCLNHLHTISPFVSVRGLFGLRWDSNSRIFLIDNFQPFVLRLENVPGWGLNSRSKWQNCRLYPWCYNHWGILPSMHNCENHLLYNVLEIINKTIILQQKFQILNFQIGITFCGCWCSTYLKASRRASLWVASSHLVRM